MHQLTVPSKPATRNPQLATRNSQLATRNSFCDPVPFEREEKRNHHQQRADDIRRAHDGESYLETVHAVLLRERSHQDAGESAEEESEDRVSLVRRVERDAPAGYVRPLIEPYMQFSRIRLTVWNI